MFTGLNEVATSVNNLGEATNGSVAANTLSYDVRQVQPDNLAYLCFCC